MMNFINLQEQEEPQNISIKKIELTPSEDPIQDIVLQPLEIPTEQKEESEGCIQEQCKINVGCSEEFFAIKNLFSELTDDYQRAIIRQNLGITDEASLLWGKIQGNLANQEDLVKFIQDTAGADADEIITQLNLKLKYWTQQIENKIESLASNITSIEVIPQYAIPNQLPVDVLLIWEYDQPVEAQAVNGIALNSNERSYIFKDVTNTLPIRLSYLYNNTWLSRNINFNVTFPIYYGTSANYEDNNYTINKSFKVNAQENQYIYVMSKDIIDLSVNGIVGGFEQVGTTNIASNRYIIYKSSNPNLGETTIRTHDQE